VGGGKPGAGGRKKARITNFFLFFIPNAVPRSEYTIQRTEPSAEKCCNGIRLSDALFHTIHVREYSNNFDWWLNALMSGRREYNYFCILSVSICSSYTHNKLFSQIKIGKIK
jgi:hypothetical protein